MPKREDDNETKIPLVLAWHCSTFSSTCIRLCKKCITYCNKGCHKQHDSIRGSLECYILRSICSCSGRGWRQISEDSKSAEKCLRALETSLRKLETQNFGTMFLMNN